MNSASATWLFDLGNTRLKFAPLQADGSLGEIRALAHADGMDIDAGVQAALPTGELALVCSVGPQPLRSALLLALAGRFQRIELATTQGRFAGLRIAYAEPAKLGVDRWLALLAVHGAGLAPALLVSVGTALTIDLLGRDGRHHGGLIAPSPTLMRQALHQRARQLPVDGGQLLDFAGDTADALASGCDGAALGLIERSLARATALLGAAPALLLHGGGAEALATHLPQAQLHHRLVLQGLARWAQG
ncbi:MAG: type III pantothenate kinase [Pseudoxanthomonas suwonensis]|nr:type III pantothenate kinase [Pseudoxanthomonas suwonensis]